MFISREEITQIKTKIDYILQYIDEQKNKEIFSKTS